MVVSIPGEVWNMDIYVGSWRLQGWAKEDPAGQSARRDRGPRRASEMAVRTNNCLYSALCVCEA